MVEIIVAEVNNWDGKPSGYEGYRVADYDCLVTAALIHGCLERQLFRPVLLEQA